MPKIRPAGASLADALKHLRVFQARIGNNTQHQEYARKITDAVVNIQVVQKNFPIDENDLELIPDNIISSELDLINQEVKKNTPKIDYRAIVRAMCNASLRDAYNIGKQHNITPEQIDQVIKRAPANSTLGKAYAALRAKTPKQAPVAPADTIDSDGNDEYTDDVKQVLEAN